MHSMTFRTIALLVLLLGGCASSRGVYHTVGSGETLYRIGRTYGVDERYLARINRIDDPRTLRAGSRLFIPGVERVRQVPSVDTASTSSRTAAVPQPPKKQRASMSPRATSGKKTTAALPQSTAKSPPRSSAKPVSAVKGKFSWPIKGEIVRRFGDKGEIPCRGLEIAAASGTPVFSAAAGRVIYSGDGIRSYGNLIILKHDESLYSVYGFNKKNMVTTGAFVGKGERIALSGVPPAGGKARLYFEIRQGKEPVNPIFYLP